MYQAVIMVLRKDCRYQKMYNVCGVMPQSIHCSVMIFNRLPWWLIEMWNEFIHIMGPLIIVSLRILSLYM